MVTQLLANPTWQTARRIFAFAPQSTEPNFLPALLPHHQLHLPRWQRDSDGSPQMVFHAAPTTHWPSLTASPWFSPPTEWPVVLPTVGDLALVPGLGFTATGVRLGRGGGYYDAWLGKHSPQIIAWGLCFACQLLPALISEPHDQKVLRVFCG
jgi:5-formyltetrahydrofolate cyclo-ligase